MDVESKEGATGEQVKALVAYVKKFGTDNELPSFMSKTKHTAGDLGGNQPGAGGRRKGDDGGAIDQLESHGYEVVPDVFEAEDDISCWGLITKVQHGNHFFI